MENEFLGGGSVVIFFFRWVFWNCKVLKYYDILEVMVFFYCYFNKGYFLKFVNERN